MGPKIVQGFPGGPLKVVEFVTNPKPHFAFKILLIRADYFLSKVIVLMKNTFSFAVELPTPSKSQSVGRN